MIETIKIVVKKLRCCEALFNDKKETKGVNTEWYGLKSSQTPKQVCHF